MRSVLKYWTKNDIAGVSTLAGNFASALKAAKIDLHTNASIANDLVNIDEEVILGQTN